MSDNQKQKTTLEFQAETRQLLDLMINSIYTNKEIFLRELISNASDAIDKIRFNSLTNNDLLENDNDFNIFITPNEDNNTLSIADNGIGMTWDNVVEHIGTIANSGTKAFLEKLKTEGNNNTQDLIGQFGVGFYSAFMVAEEVTIITRAPQEKEGVKWQSHGDGSYTIEPCEKAKRGTEIILKLKTEFCNKDEHETNFLNRDNLQRLVKKYSDYIRYPIKMNFFTEKDGAKEIELRTLNSMTSLWTKNKKDITKEEYNDLYKTLFHDWQPPLEVIHSKLEGLIEYTTLLFIPEHAPFNFYERETQYGLRLYSKNVFIMENCADLLPEYLKFVRGLVDSPDFSLNISRELLQHSTQLKSIGKNLELNILKTLAKMQENERERYEKFWKEFGIALKHGVYSHFDQREKLQDLLLFNSSKEEKLITLAEYVSRMPENQKVIYYASGKDRATVERLPQMELLREKGLEVLYLFDRVDEFAIDALREYKDKKFQSISRGDLQIDDLENNEEAKTQQKEIEKSNEKLIAAIKKQLSEKVSDVKISHRLKSSAVCLVSSDQGISISMEKILSEMNQSMFKANRILEVNPQHALFKTMQNIFEQDSSSATFKDYCQMLYDQALLIEGLTPDDPIAFANKIAELMAKK